jgi:hypothetical protein
MDAQLLQGPFWRLWARAVPMVEGQWLMGNIKVLKSVSSFASSPEARHRNQWVRRVDKGSTDMIDVNVGGPAGGEQGSSSPTSKRL